MKFGIDSRKHITGASLYMYAFQTVSLFPLVYIIVAMGYIGVTSSNNVISYLFDLGMAALPRYEALLVSLFYRRTLSEIAVFFVIIGIALIFGFVLNRLLKGSEKTAIITRIVLIALIAIELVIRLLPLSFNSGFGLTASIIALVFRVACLILIVIDLTVYKKRKAVTG